MTPDITIRPVTKDNWEEALMLTVHREQLAYIPPVAVSIASAYIKPGDINYEPYAVYAADAMVGFFSYMHEEGGNPHVAYISGFLIAAEHQGRGYGRAALMLFLDMVREKQPACREVLLSAHPDNVAARRLYESVGFAKTGEVLEEEDVFRLELVAT